MATGKKLIKPKKTPLKDIAARINSHLRAFEANLAINVLDPTYKTRPYYHAGASAPKGSRFVYVTYVSYQGHQHLERETAEDYLRALDSGFVCGHSAWRQLTLAEKAAVLHGKVSS